MRIIVLILCVYLHRYFNINANKIIFIMKLKKYFFTRSNGFASESFYCSSCALRRALLEQFSKLHGDSILFVHYIDGRNIYYCGSVTLKRFDSDFSNLELYDND